MPVNPNAREAIVKALSIYLGLLRRRPGRINLTQHPFGKIRAEFDQALLAGNETDASRLRDQLIATGRLDIEQQQYLEIRMLAGLGHQHPLARNYLLIRAVMGLSLPPQTIADLAGALYETAIAPIENDENIGQILSVFRSAIAHPFGPLFKARKGVCQTGVLKAFLLFELTREQPNQERCKSIVSACPSGSARDLLDRWLRHCVTPAQPVEPDTRALSSQEPVAPDARELSNQALLDEEYPLALKWAFVGLPQSWAYVTLLRCADELEDAAITCRVLEVVNEATDEVRRTWKPRDLTRLEQLQQRHLTAGTAIVTNQSRPDSDWLSWVQSVENGQQAPLQILESAMPRWAMETYASEPETCRQLANKLDNASTGAQAVFRDAFAALVEFFVDRPASPVRAFLPLYITLLRTLAYSDTASANELELATAIMQALTSVGPSLEEYVEALECYEEILKHNQSPVNIDWALNAAEMLALSASPDSETRLRYFMAVVAMARNYCHRLKPVQYEILALLARDYDCTNLLEAFPQPETPEESVAKTGFKGLIGIYTLTESAGQRARDFLTRYLPDVRIEINSDGVATSRLKHLAATADIFVLAWKSSKHQAYYAAKEARGERLTLLPAGKGSASILGSVLAEIIRAG